MIIGIDPGWASCGYSVTLDGKVLVKGNFVPRDEVGPAEVLVGAVERLTSLVEDGLKLVHEDDSLKSIFKMYIERFVAYKGVQSEVNEAILMFIGAVIHKFESGGAVVVPVRAIDWKPKVCKYLVRTQNFNNPYPSFDKKYSILAASALSGLQFKTDHEADAVCLSYLEIIDRYNAENKK